MTDRTTWSERHERGAPASPPSPFVRERAQAIAALSPHPRALDLACGAGRHARLLAELGFETIALDFALPALRRIRDREPRVLAVAADATRLPLAEDCFDLVVQTCFLDRALFPSLARLLRPGGVLVAETFARAQFEATGHPRREFCVEPGELARLCGPDGAGLEIVAVESTNRGDDHHPRHLDAVEARRP